MVAGLQEGFIYRDLLGRTVSPEVREQLRQGFASGNLKLEGQNVTATVLMSDIRGFTTLSENEQPTNVLAWLNEYFGGLVPIISGHGGVVDKFEGDAILAFFGILPQPLSPKESAYQACRAAVDMLKRVDRLNDQRATNGQPPFVTGIGLNTGLVTAGGLGTADRLNYTVIGDAVNIAQRLESFTREFGTSAIVLSVNTAAALEERAAEFRLELLGTQSLKGKREEVTIYRLHGLAEPLHQAVP
jgi:adenylate cyclase